MNIKEMKSVIESLLFVTGDLLNISKIADVLDIDKSTAMKLMTLLMDEYNTAEHGIHILKIDDSFQLCSSAENFEYVSKLVNTKKPQPLSNALLEVLSIIAYNQPITKSTIEEIRGVSSDYLVNKLIDRNLVQECGRLNAPGKPILFKTTDEFLRQFGISSLSELPSFESLSGSLDENSEKDELTISDLLHEEEMKKLANDDYDDDNSDSDYNTDTDYDNESFFDSFDNYNDYDDFTEYDKETDNEPYSNDNSEAEKPLNENNKNS